MKIVLFANTDWYLYNFRLPLAQALRARGAEVIFLSPPGGYTDKLRSAGFRWETLPMKTGGTNPFAEINTLWHIWRFYRHEKPDLVHHYTIKSVLYGSLAAHLAGTKAIINSVTGLGFIFTGNGAIRRILRSLVIPAYRLVLRGTRIIFQNPADRAAFLEMRLVSPGSIELVPGSGVDINLFQPSPEPQGTPIILFPGRLLRDKGIFEFIEAGRIFKEKEIPARFVLVGDLFKGNPTSITAAQLQGWQDSGLVEYWGWNDKMNTVYPQANIICLPSYREGLSKTLIEACASGRAIVTTDVPGCRDVVRHGENGLLVPAQDASALAEALQALITSPQTRQQMAVAGRKLAEQYFSTEHIIHETLDVYARAGVSSFTNG